LELWNTDTKLGHTFYVDMVARLHPFLISANGRWFMPVQPLDKTNEPHGLAKLGGVSGENENF
jgi:hypothetical protein